MLLISTLWVFFAIMIYMHNNDDTVAIFGCALNSIVFSVINLMREIG